MDNNRTTPVTENNGRDISIFDRFNSEKYLSYFDSLYNQTKKYFVSISVDLYNAILEDCIDNDNISWFIETLSKDIFKDNTSFIKIQNVIIPFDAIWNVDAKYKCTDMCKKYESIFSLLTLYSVLSITKASEPNSAEKRKIIHDVMVQYDNIIKIILDDIDDDDLLALDDDIENIDTERLVNRFFKALKKEDRDACLIILGMADRLPLEFINHFKALLYFNEAKYEKAIFYAKKVDKDKLYYNNAIAIILESYASLGDFNGILETLNDVTTLSISLSAVNYLIGKAFINYNGKIEDVTDSWIEIRNKCVSMENNNQTACDYFTLKCLELVSDSFESVFKFCYDSCIYPIDHKMVSYKNETNRALKLLETFQEVASEIVTDTKYEDLPWQYTHNKDGKIIPDPVNYVSRYYSKVRNKIKEDLIDDECLNYLQLMNHEWCRFVRVTMSDAKSSLKTHFTIRLSLLKSFYDLKQIDCFFGTIKDFFAEILNNNLEYEFVDERFLKLVLCAYIEGKARGWFDPNQKSDIEKFVEQRYKPNDYNDKIRIARLKKDLSISSQIAFDAAEEQYELSKTANWGWKDAGMISLAYYRIVELEINERLLIPIITEEQGLIKNGKPSEINSLYDVSKENMPTEKINSEKSIKEQYCNCWGTNITEIMKQIDPDNKLKMYKGKQNKTKNDKRGLELGGLHYWFDALDKKDKFPEENDVLAKHLKDKINDFLKEPQDLDKFIRHLNTTLLLNENRDKYRNPPAHTTYLPYKTACECREYVIENLTKFVSMLKEPDEYPNQTNDS